MIYTDNSIKVIVISESYTFTGRRTKCSVLVRLRITSVLYFEYEANGYTVCRDGDTYDESIGRRMSKAKAVSKAYKKALVYAKMHYIRQLRYIDSYLDFLEKADRVIADNSRYIRSCTDGRQDNKRAEGEKE